MVLVQLGCVMNACNLAYSSLDAEGVLEQGQRVCFGLSGDAHTRSVHAIYPVRNQHHVTLERELLCRKNGRKSDLGLHFISGWVSPVSEAPDDT